MYWFQQRYNEIPLGENSINENTVFGYPVQKTANTACAIGIVVAILYTIAYALKIPWSELDFKTTTIAVGSLLFFVCVAIVAHGLLAMSVKEGDGTLIGAACCSYGLYCNLVFFLFYVEFMTSAFDESETRTRSSLNSSFTFATTSRRSKTPDTDIVWLLQMAFRVVIIVTNFTVGAVYLRCNQLLQYKRRQRREENVNSSGIP